MAFNLPVPVNIIPDPERAGMFEIAKANDTVRRQSKLPDPEDLYRQLWHEGEIACLFADTNVGKSVLAVQIGEDIAKSKPVLYVDCELSDKQFQIRYTSKEDHSLHVFPDMFYRGSISPDGLEQIDISYEDLIMNNIEAAANKIGAKVIIIDNLTFLCLASEKGEEAALLMLKLCRLKRRYGWSVLVIAHTPKRREWDPITPNDLAGSRKLANFFDTIFALGKCHYDENIRYVIQLKVRMAEYTYTRDHVLKCRKEMVDGNCLRLTELGFSTEREMLADSPNMALKEEAARLHDEEHLTYKEIGEKLGRKSSTVHGWVKEFRILQQREMAYREEEIEEVEEEVEELEDDQM